MMNRGFYALPLLDKNGVYTNAVLGFLNILIKTIEEEKPEYLTVAFDVHAPTFRHEMFKEYKGTRSAAPTELISQFPIMEEVLTSMGVRIVKQAGFEADDLLGTLAKKSEKEGLDVTLLSGDRDLLQIASDKIKSSIPKTSKGVTQTFYYYAKDVMEEKGVTPLEFIDVKALQGDTSDNIPGVPGVGPKTAEGLIKTYHNLENLYDHLDDLKGKKALYANLSENKENAFFSRTLSRIEINAPVDLDLNNSECKNLLNDNSMEVLLKYSLRKVIEKLSSFSGAKEVNEAKDDIDFTVVSSKEEAKKALSLIKGKKSVSLYGCDEGLSVTVSDETYFIEFNSVILKDFLTEEVRNNLEPDTNVNTLNIKTIYDYVGEYKDSFDDAEILAYLADPLKGEYNISYLCDKYLSKYFDDDKALLKEPKKRASLITKYAGELVSTIKEEVKKMGEEELYRKIEMPLSFVLYSMEKDGVYVDKKALKAFGEKLTVKISELEKSIYEAAGEEFNINSPKQLGVILFEKMNLPHGKKTKTGYSTSADILERLSGEYPIVSDILEYRMLTKLNSTYVEGLTACIKEDGRIHTHFNQTITATGRISSTEPNLQNIPIRRELGRELRKVFLPKPGFKFIDADYSQIELRLMAHMSGDEKMIGAFKEKKDIHRSTASIVFEVPYDEVTSELRRQAKAVNFGIIYGISDYGLSEDTGLDFYVAKKHKEDYFSKYSKIKEYIDSTVEKAKEDGFVTTLYKRVRPIPELSSSNFMLRSFGERVAMNAPIQGTAADIMKIAMINIFNRLKEEKLESKLLIQVHDEVLLEVKESEIEKVKEIVSDEMTNAASLSVELESEVNVGDTWFDAH
ncbi:MAG: DNA polymerase I [Lachnospiraceae bacterium]|nr:DNA polymerase I [Lachnospiraceae bacterium]